MSLESLFTDAGITEILFQSHNEIWIERDGRLSLSDKNFETPNDYHNFLHRVFTEARVRPDLEIPFADGAWNGFRLHYIQPPLAVKGPLLTLRKRSPQAWSLSSLEEFEWAPPSAIKLLKEMIAQKKSLLIVGSTGSGKTSVLNACLKTVGDSERVVVIEDTDEIYISNGVSVKLLTRDSLSTDLKMYSQSDLVRHSLRMRPDRIVMGEVRGGEAKDLLLAFSTGHTGGLATLHAENSRQALLRLEMLVQMGAPQWSLSTIRTLIQTGFHAVICVERKNEKRRLHSISRISSLEDTGFCLEPLFKSDEN